MNDFGAAGWEPDPAWAQAEEARNREEERRKAAARADLEAPDPDFTVLTIDLAFTVEGAPSNSDYPDKVIGSEASSEDWCVIADDIFDDQNAERNRRLVDALIREVGTSLLPWVRRFAVMGLVRGDNVFCCMHGNTAATFYLITKSADYIDALSELAGWPVVATSLTAVPDCWLEVKGLARPINATKLFEALSVLEWSVGEFGGPATPHLLPSRGEGRDEWLARVAIDKSSLESILSRWEAVGCDPLFYDLFGTAAERSTEAGRSSQWLVEGRLPRGQITSLVGNGQTGKSSLAHEIASALGCIEKSTKEPRAVLGQPVIGIYMVAMLTGEDSGGTIQFRQDRHATIWGNSRTYQLNGSDLPFGEWLEALCALPRLDLLIVDPVVKFLDGNEDSADTVSRFYSRLERLARLQDCAVLVVHHLTKGRPRSLGQMLTMVRGSGVHTDRPRLVWGMRDLGNGLVEVGLIKSNFAEGEIGWALNQGRVYRRDPSTFTLRAVTAEGELDRHTADVSQLVLTSVERLNRQGRVCRRSGKRGVFELRLPELAGLPRASILASIEELLGQGALRDGEAGLQCVSQPCVPAISPPVTCTGDARSEPS